MFGVRRPLRFMARALELDEDQVAELASIMADLKNERAQVRLDQQKSVTAFADAMDAVEFDREAVETAGQVRVDSAARHRDAVTRALERTHQMLSDEQRRQLAYLLRSGALTI